LFKNWASALACQPPENRRERQRIQDIVIQPCPGCALPASRSPLYGILLQVSAPPQVCMALQCTLPCRIHSNTRYMVLLRKPKPEPDEKWEVQLRKGCLELAILASL